MVATFGISTSVLAALCLLFSTGKYDVAHDPETNSGVNYFCMIEQLLVALLYLCIIFFEKVQQYLLSLSWFQKSTPAEAVSVAQPENTNDNFQHVIEVPTPEPVPEPRESKLSDDDDMVIVHKIEQNKAEAIAEAKVDISENAESVSETDELIEPPTKELHAQVGERKSSDV